MKLVITHNDTTHHVNECTKCTKDDVAPNGFSRTTVIDMVRAITAIHSL